MKGQFSLLSLTILGEAEVVKEEVRSCRFLVFTENFSQPEVAILLNPLP